MACPAPCRKSDHPRQILVKLGPAGLECEARPPAGPGQILGPESGGDHLVAQRSPGLGKDLAKRIQHVGQARMGAVAVEVRLVCEYREDAVTAGVRPVGAGKRGKALSHCFELLVLSDAFGPARSGGVGKQDHLGAPQRQNAPRLTKQGVVADQCADSAVADVERLEAPAHSEAEVLIPGSVHLALNPDHPVRSDQGL